MAHNPIILPNGQQVVLVDREQLRLRGVKKMSMPSFFAGFVAQPTPPPTFDWTKGRQLKFPIYGNDQYGDCYYCAPAHLVQSWTGMAGTEAQFDRNAIVQRYLRISGGDNGLDDGTILPEFKSGIVGPSGPHKIEDYVQVDPNDDAASAFAAWAFGGLLWTCSLLNTWLNTQPGSVWTNNGRPNRNAGHAMHVSGKTDASRYQVETWGFDPPVQVTTAGVKAADSEFLACFSLEMFSAKGFAPCGLHYLDLVPLWQSIGGHALPPSPFPTPAPELLNYIP